MAGTTKSTLQLPGDGIDLETTLFCGQSFSWRAAGPGAYAGVAGTRAARVHMQGDTLYLQSLNGSTLSAEDTAFWQNYFALDEDYTALCGRFAQDETLARCVAFAPGIRVLRQPFFDTLLSFIISQNNHIGRITGIVQRLCALCGAPIAGGEVHAFPTPQALAALPLEALAPLRAGFRAKYLLDAAQRVAAGQVSEAALRDAGTADARQMLMQISGVGPKVADCVLLFGLGRCEVAPMDVWMKRAMAQLFPGGLPPCAAGHEGIAQQYIFHWARAHLPRGEKKGE